MEIGKRPIPEAILLEIIARLPLRIITRCKSVCKQWKSLIESPYFRRHFISLHQTSSSSWSLIVGSDHPHPITEAISFYGCKTWSLPKSPCSYYIFPASRFFYVASSNGLIWIDVFFNTNDNNEYIRYSYKSFVGNPVLNQWIQIPPTPDESSIATGLATRVNEDGVVSGFKLIRTRRSKVKMGIYIWRVCVYSSETGLWTFRQLQSSHPVNYTGYYPPMNLNGTLYLRENGVIISHDFYGREDDDQCIVTPLPLPYNKDARRCLTTSGGNVIYIEILHRRLKLWKLNIQCWQLLQNEIDMASVGFDVDCIPFTMNPFDVDIVYLWSREHGCLVSGNLRTLEFIVHQEIEDGSDSEGCWSINTSDSKAYVEDGRNLSSVIMLSRFVLPRWMDSVPLPPN